MPPSENCHDDHAAVVDALRTFFQRSQRVLDRVMTAEGASFAQTKLLMLISSSSNVRSADIARIFGFAPRTITEALDILERDGLVRRVADISDRRAKVIVLTPAGAAALAASDPMRQHFANQLFGVLDDRERSLLVTCLDKLVSRLDDIEARS